MSLLAQVVYGTHGDSCGRTESHYEGLGILCMIMLGTNFLLLYSCVFLLQFAVALLHQRLVKFQTCHNVWLPTFKSKSVSGPRALPAYFLIGAPWSVGGQCALLHHLSNAAVGQDDYRGAPLHHQFLGKSHHVATLLHRAWSKHYGAVVTVAASAGSLPVVGLRRLYGAKARTSALY